MKRERICLIIACLLSFALTTGIMEWRMEVVHAEIAQTQKTLAEEVFRFHVIAESNSVKDQRPDIAKASMMIPGFAFA